MNLLQIRTALINRSGRFDLVTNTTTYLDNGANAYIQEGQRWLDRRFFVGKARRRWFKKLAIGAIGVIVPDLRVAEEIWVANSESRTKLERVDLDELKETYNEPFASLEQGCPLYWAPTVVGTVPEGPTWTVSELGFIVGYADIMLSADYGTLSGASTWTDYRGLIFMPPADEEYSVDLTGLFYQTKLVSDTQQNYWSVVYPDILIMAALRQMEVFYRNTQGVNDMTSNIMQELEEINKDQYMEDSEHATQMEG